MTDDPLQVAFLFPILFTAGLFVLSLYLMVNSRE